MYHLTDRYLGEEVILKPRGKNKFTGLPARVCAAPTVEQCIMALPYWRYKSGLWVYQIDRIPTRRGTEWDTPVTDEHWYTSPVKARFVEAINIEECEIIGTFAYDESGVPEQCPMKMRLKFMKVKLDMLRYYMNMYK